jgi:hypothetical protein
MHCALIEYQSFHYVTDVLHIFYLFSYFAVVLLIVCIKCAFALTVYHYKWYLNVTECLKIILRITI